MKTILLAVASVLGMACSSAAEPAQDAANQARLVYSEQVFDFGHVGIDFKLFHTFYIVNNGMKPVPIIKAASLCDCSHISYTDSIVNPGDTAFFHLEFLTRNYYGPTTKSMTVELDDPEFPKVKFYYLSTIGQWYGNLKPDPFSLFFLPGTGPKQVTLKNEAFEQLSWSLRDRGHTYFEVDLVKVEADKGETLTVEVSPADSLTAGTYMSSFTLHVSTAEDQKPVILTIPVKIVKY